MRTYQNSGLSPLCRFGFMGAMVAALLLAALCYVTPANAATAPAKPKAVATELVQTGNHTMTVKITPKFRTSSATPTKMQVRYSTKKSMKKATKKTYKVTAKQVKKANAKTSKISKKLKLKATKTYYIQVRLKSGSKTGKWSKKVVVEAAESGAIYEEGTQDSTDSVSETNSGTVNGTSTVDNNDAKEGEAEDTNSDSEVSDNATVGGGDA